LLHFEMQRFNPSQIARIMGRHRCTVIREVKRNKTNDNKYQVTIAIERISGTEFHGYKDVENKTGTRFYFAQPYHSWERGCNENAA